MAFNRLEMGVGHVKPGNEQNGDWYEKCPGILAERLWELAE